MHKSLMSITGILLLAGILILVNGIGRHVFTQFSWDVTEENLYSLSEGSKNIISKLEDEVVLRLYFSSTDGSKFPAVKLYGSRIVDLLKEYERAGGGKVRLEVYDPRPDSDEEVWAQKYGISPIPTRTGERLFLGLAGSNSEGDEEVIPVFDLGRQNFLEYDITKLVHRLSKAAKPKIGIISALPIPENPAEMTPQGQIAPYLFVSQVEQLGEVKVLENSVEAIDQDIELLMVIHPRGFSEKTLYAIDQHVMRGGKLLALVDPFSEADEGEPKDPQNPNPMPTAKASDLNRLTKHWGVEMVEKKAVADINLAFSVSTGQPGPLQAFVLWLNLRGQETFNQEDIVTNALEDVLLPWPGALNIKDMEGVTVEPLLTSSEQAMMIPESNYIFRGGQPQDLIRRYVRGSERQVLAARIRGTLKSAFADGAPGETQAGGGQMSHMSGHLPESTQTANVVIVADSDFIGNRFSLVPANFFGQQIVTMRNGNLVFLLNAVENLLGSSDLIGIRSRGRFSRPFTKVKELEHRAEQRWRQEEMTFQAKVNSANQRLRQLQSSGNAEGASDQQLFDSKVLEEIKRLRDERKEAQQNLRGVRRNLRQDKERLGDILFMINTFLVPLLLVLWSVASYRMKSRQK